MQRTGIGVAALWALAASSCNQASAPAFPAGATRFDPPAVFAQWWRETEACSELQREFADVTWYAVSDDQRIVVGGRTYDAYWWARPSRIVVRAGVLYDGPLVRHEMLHALTGSGTHGNAFVRECAGVVECGAQCRSEAGPGVTIPTNAREVLLSDVITTVRVELTESGSTEGRWVTVVVDIANPFAEPVWVILGSAGPNQTSWPTFGYVIECATSCAGPTGSSYDYAFDNRFPIEASEHRAQLFDHHLGPGDYRIRGTFATDTTDAITISVR